MRTPEKQKFSTDDIMISRFAKALGHPARLIILRQLASTGSCCFNELSENLPLAESTVSQHISELKEAGIVSGEYDPPRIHYSINRKEWKAMSHLMKDLMEIKVPKQ
jgi:ArsR family transcriptional regulator, arsenate/arsenite/antimonite-responsive transcriptional repressor